MEQCPTCGKPYAATWKKHGYALIAFGVVNAIVALVFWGIADAIEASILFSLPAIVFGYGFTNKPRGCPRCVPHN